MSQRSCLVRPAHLTGVRGRCCVLRLDLQASIGFWWMLSLKCAALASIKGEGVCVGRVTCTHSCPLPHCLGEITGVQLLQTTLVWGGWIAEPPQWEQNLFSHSFSLSLSHTHARPLQLCLFLHNKATFDKWRGARKFTWRAADLAAFLGIKAQRYHVQC